MEELTDMAVVWLLVASHHPATWSQACVTEPLGQIHGLHLDLGRFMGVCGVVW
jgi:hypothetical protein